MLWKHQFRTSLWSCRLCRIARWPYYIYWYLSAKLYS